MSNKPPKITIPGMNRGAGVPGGYILGRRRGSKQGPVELLDIAQLRGIGIASAVDVTSSTSLVQSIAHSETISLSRSVSTSLSAISSAVSGAVSSTSSLSSAISTVISGSISTVTSMVNSLSTAGGGGGGGTGKATAGSTLAAASASASAAKASILSPVTDFTLYAAWFRVDEVNTATYVAMLCEVNASTFAITAVLQTSATATASATVANTRYFTLGAGTLLSSTKTYALIHVRTDATNTTSSGLYNSTLDADSLPVFQKKSFARYDNVAPIVGTTASATGSTGVFHYGVVFSL